jgi:hypothetical protein
MMTLYLTTMLESRRTMPVASHGPAMLQPSNENTIDESARE